MWLFIDQVPLSLTDEDLRALCTQYGSVRTVQLGRFCGQALGFARVEMRSLEDAQAGRRALDGTPVHGLVLSVTILPVDTSPFFSST